MANNTKVQVLASLAFLVIAIAFLNPLHILMTDMIHMFILALLVAVFGVLATLIIRERGGDEREVNHRMLAGRAAFLAGAFILLLGIVWQAFTSTVDIWLVLALCGMVLAKTCARIYGEQRY